MFRQQHFRQLVAESNELAEQRIKLQEEIRQYTKRFGLPTNSVSVRRLIEAKFCTTEQSYSAPRQVGHSLLISEADNGSEKFYLVFTQENEEGVRTPFKIQVENETPIKWVNIIEPSIHLETVPTLTLNLSLTRQRLGEMAIFNNEGRVEGYYSYYGNIDGDVLSSSNSNTLTTAIQVLSQFNEAL